MATRFWSVVFDANDHAALARFWSDALGWALDEEPGYTSVRGPDDEVPRLEFVPSDAPKLGKNRFHIDLSTTSSDHYDATVARLLGLGAVRADIGQGDIEWVVLADPEGNEFCVLRPDKEYGRAAPIGTFCLDGEGVRTMADFWSAATGWHITRCDPHVAVLDPGGGPTLVTGPKVAPKHGKNRLHIDVCPPADGDQGAEVARLEALGARRIDIGQGDVPWVVMADPEDNEFCVLQPR